jgi:hypothetical protein
MTYKNDSGFPSPSDILKPWVDTRWFKPEHSDRGNSVHTSIGASMKDLVPIWDPEFYGYRDSFNQIRDYFEDVIISEQRLVDKNLCYSGQPDAVVKLSKKACDAFAIDYPATALVDWKTSVQEQKSWVIQAAAYFNLCVVNDINCDLHLLARIRRDGDFPKIKVSHKEEIRFYFVYFKAMLNSWYFFNTGVKFQPKEK